MVLPGIEHLQTSIYPLGQSQHESRAVLPDQETFTDFFDLCHSKTLVKVPTTSFTLRIPHSKSLPWRFSAWRFFFQPSLAVLQACLNSSSRTSRFRPDRAIDFSVAVQWLVIDYPDPHGDLTCFTLTIVPRSPLSLSILHVSCRILHFSTSGSNPERLPKVDLAVDLVTPVVCLSTPD